MTEMRLGASACLMGDEVRYDGGHRRDPYVMEVLARYFTLVKVCPEVGVGMSTPRETVRLEGRAEAPRMIASETGSDWTIRMNRWSRTRVRELKGEDLCGFVFKRNSPSCGVFGVEVFDDKGRPAESGSGLFVLEFRRKNPLAPVEEEGRLEDPVLRENFLERVFAYHRLKRVFDGRWKRGAVFEFHNREKYLLQAHSPKHFKQMEQLTGTIGRRPAGEFKLLYMTGFMEAMGIMATTARHAKVLRRLAVCLRGQITVPEYDRVVGLIEGYRSGHIPLVVPLTLLSHFGELHKVVDLVGQTYLHPHPNELMLRNHV
ncbi:MAG: DUF1722 domain-containing protein [Candidatus Krumholzibacteria bacterium]|nr:DUF1722 domain-containing protein [Candidatus Krumholzibacteria bacterium]